MPVVFSPAVCDQQLIQQPDSLPKPKKYILILIQHNAREVLNTEVAMCMDNLAPVHWVLEDLTSSEPPPSTCTCPLPRAHPDSCLSSGEAQPFSSPLSFWIPATANTQSNFTGVSDQRFTATVSAKASINPWRVCQKLLYICFPHQCLNF